MCSPELLRRLRKLQGELDVLASVHLNQMWGEVAAVKRQHALLPTEYLAREGFLSERLVAARLGAHPWIERVTLSKRFPDGLLIRIAERRAVALFREGERLWWLGSDGRLIARYDPRDDRGEYILVSGDRRALPDAVGLLEDLAGGEPEYFSALSEITVLSGGGFGMMDSIFRTPVRILRNDAPEKIRALLDARALIESRGWEARAIDLRFADRIVLVGAYGAGDSL